jgi:hypothetical protein
MKPEVAKIPIETGSVEQQRLLQEPVVQGNNTVNKIETINQLILHQH